MLRTFFSRTAFLRKNERFIWEKAQNLQENTSKISELITKGEEPKFELFRNIFVENFFDKKVLEDIYKELKEKEIKIPSSLYQALISFSSKDEEIENYIQEIKSLQLEENFEILKTLMFYFLRKGQDDKFLEAISSMKQKEFPLDSDIYCLLIKFYNNKGQIEKAEEIIKEIKAKKIKGTNWYVLYQILFNLYKNDETKLLKLVKDLKKKGELNLKEGGGNEKLISFQSIPNIFEAPKLNISPKEIVEQLDKYIVGQQDAKKVVSIAFKNRLRRRLLDDKIKKEIIPKNILMIGPTGSGKTEICRRLSTIIDVPFVKVEATQYTEVGYHGKDVDSIIQDLVNNGIEKMKKRIENDERIEILAYEIIAKILFDDSKSPELWKQMIESGEFDDYYISYKKKSYGLSYDYHPKKRVKVPEAKKIIKDELIERIINKEDFKPNVISFIEQESIVFIDEIDKICSSEKGRDNPSSEGVQRDLLPLIEGTNVQTDYGKINTENILFICSGAFHNVKPKDLMPELQGRLPIRVELTTLKQEDFYAILTKTHMNILKQNIELLKADKIELDFTDDAIEEISKLTFEMNSFTENLGARRLNTIIEKLVEEYSFENKEGKYTITKDIVRQKLDAFMKKSDLSKFII